MFSHRVRPSFPRLVIKCLCCVLSEVTVSVLKLDGSDQQLAVREDFAVFKHSGHNNHVSCLPYNSLITRVNIGTSTSFLFRGFVNCWRTVTLLPEERERERESCAEPRHAQNDAVSILVRKCFPFKKLRTVVNLK